MNFFHHRLHRILFKETNDNQINDTQEQNIASTELSATAAEVMVSSLYHDLISKVKAALPDNPQKRQDMIKAIEQALINKIAPEASTIEDAIKKSVENVNTSSKVVSAINAIIQETIKIDAITIVNESSNKVQTLIKKAKYIDGKGITKTDLDEIITGSATLLDTKKKKTDLDDIKTGVENSDKGENLINNDILRGIFSMTSLDMSTKDVTSFMSCFSQETIQAVVAQAQIPAYIESHDVNSGAKAAQRFFKSFDAFKASNKELFTDVIFNKGKSGFMNIMKQVKSINKTDRDAMAKQFDSLKTLEHTLHLDPLPTELESMLKSQLPAGKDIDTYKKEVKTKVEELSRSMHILSVFQDCDDTTLDYLIKAVEQCKNNEDKMNVLMFGLGLAALAAAGLGITAAIIATQATTAATAAGLSAAAAQAAGTLAAAPFATAGTITGGVVGGVNLIGKTTALFTAGYTPEETTIDGKQTKKRKERSIDTASLEKDTYITTLIQNTLEDLQTKYDEKNTEGYLAAFQNENGKQVNDIKNLNERAQKAWKRAIFFHIYKGITKAEDKTIKELDAYKKTITSTTTTTDLLMYIKNAAENAYTDFNSKNVHTLTPLMEDLVAKAGEQNIKDETKKLNKNTKLNKKKLEGALATAKMNELKEEVKDIIASSNTENTLQKEFDTAKKIMLDSYKKVEAELFNGNDTIEKDQKNTLAFLKTLQDPRWDKYYSIPQIQEEFSKHWLGISFLFMQMKEQKTAIQPYMEKGNIAIQKEKTLYNINNPLTYDEKSTYGALKGIYSMSMSEFGQLKEKVDQIIANKAGAIVGDIVSTIGDICALIGGVNATMDVVNKNNKPIQAPLDIKKPEDKIKLTELETLLKDQGIIIPQGKLLENGITSEHVDKMKSWPKSYFDFLKKTGYLNDGSTLGMIGTEKVSDWLSIDTHGALTPDVIDNMSKWGAQLVDKDTFNKVMLHGGYGRANFPWDTPVDWRRFGHGYEQDPKIFFKLLVENPTYTGENNALKTFRDTINNFFGEESITKKLQQLGLPNYLTQLEQIKKGDIKPVQEIVKKLEPVITALPKNDILNGVKATWDQLKVHLPLAALAGTISSYLMTTIQNISQNTSDGVDGGELLSSEISKALDLNRKAKYAGDALHSPQLRYAAYKEHMPELFQALSEATMSRKELLQRIDTEANRKTLITHVATIEERRYDVAGVGIKENLLRQISEQKQTNPSEAAKWGTIYTTVEKANIKIHFSEQDKKDMHWHAFFGVLPGA